MKNPLNKRILKEFKEDIGKYLVIFLFMIMLISLVSGFLVANSSISTAYEEGFTKYKLEWGHFTLSQKPSEEFLEELSKASKTELYDLSYFEETEKKTGATIRVYQNRETIDLACVMSGRLPESEKEIALDRMFAKNAGLSLNDTIELRNNTLTVVGLVALPDYSCLFEKNTDMMFDSINFCVALMTKDGFEAVNSRKNFYNYGWRYVSEPETEREEKELSDEFLEDLKSEVLAFANQGELLSIDEYVPRYNNQAINFTGNDMGGDKAMFILFDYIVVCILAFVFAVTISNTISSEAGVIGTLRASGYTRGELIRHYMILPMCVTLASAVVGNLLGYTVLKGYMVELYYNSYSLATYETLWNGEAFIDTTLVPVLLMFIINLFVLVRKLSLSPLAFLRRDLTKKKHKKAVRLSTKLPFLQRFRIRILLQNLPNYLTLFVGILLAALILVFGLMFGPLLEDYSVLVSESMLAKYQYVMKTPVEIENGQAEKYCLTELETTKENYMTDEIAIYGIERNSAYVKTELKEGEVVVSESILKKFGLKEGDTLTLKEKYTDTTYDFVVSRGYDYEASLAVFLAREDYLKVFHKDSDYFTGYFSDETLKELPEEAVATIITKEDLTKVSRQLLVSMGDFMELYLYFGVIMFVLLMYLLSKQVVEKNAQSIAMTKILGFTNLEIGSLYIAATSVVVILSLLLAVPIIDRLLYYLFSSYLYTEITGYIPYIISNSCFVKMVILGLVSYAFVAALQFYKIWRIPKSNALKNVE